MDYSECYLHAMHEKSHKADPSTRQSPTEAPHAISLWTGHAREQAVQRMFTAIARFYDLNNSLLSFGLHHRWKRAAAAFVPAMADGAGIDIGAGTGDLAILLTRRLGEHGRVLAGDLNLAMLREGAQKVTSRKLRKRIDCLQLNAEQLACRNEVFDVATAGFCIRNVGDLTRAFTEIHRVLKPGGRFICLEFSRPVRRWLLRAYDWYSFRLLPRIGTLVAGDKTGVYEYLPASIRTFPDQEGLKSLLIKAGFRDVMYRNLSGGIVAIHVAIK